MNNISCENNPQYKEDFQAVNDFLKIINEPNRLKILCLLKHNEQCVCEIWKNLDLPQNLTSHHLKILKDFGLIEAKQNNKEGRKIIYSSNKEAILKYTSLLNNFLFFNL